MLNKIIHFSLTNRLVVLFSAVILIIAGVYITNQTEVDVFPDLNAPTVVVMTEANGMAAEEVEQLVTFPIETSVNGATGVRRVRSSSTNSFSVVWVEFDWGTDIYLARQIVSEKLAIVNEALPNNVGKPTLGPQSSILGEVLIIGLSSDSTSMLDLRTLADWSIRPRLLSTGGVAQVSVLGGDVKEFQIQLDPKRMNYYGVGVDEVLKASKEMNLNTNGGVIYQYGNEYIVRGMISTADVELIGKSLIKKELGKSPILLEDIADVKIDAKTPKLGLASERGKHGVLLTVTKQPNVGTIELTNHIEKALTNLKSSLPSDIKISTDIFRQSTFIENSIGNVERSIFEGGIFVVIVLFIFLANFRTTIISLITIPISMIVAIVVMHYLGLTINTMSLGGLAIAIGSLVDDAIVDVENVYKRLRENRERDVTEQLPSIKVIYEASKEVRMPIFNSTLIIITSFVPLFFLSGMEGRMLTPLGISFITALLASTIVALTLTPVLSSYLLCNNDKSMSKEVFFVRWLKKRYKKALEWTFNHQKITVGTTLLLFVITLFIGSRLGNSFLPSFNEGSYTINVSSLPGISLEESDKLGHQAEEILLSIPEIQTVARKTGRAELDEHALGVNVSELEAPFILEERSKDELTRDIREKLATLNGAMVEIGQPISHRIDAMLSGTRANIAIKLFGDNLNKMFKIGSNIKSSIAAVDGIVDLNIEQQIERPQLTIKPNRTLLAYHGITIPEFNEFINTCLAGETVSQVYEKGRQFDLVVITQSDLKDTRDKLHDLYIKTPEGGQVPIGELAEIKSSMGPNTISRENVKRKIVISANVDGRDLRGAVNEIQEVIEKSIELPEGYHVEYGGQFESEQAASRTLMITSIISIIVIFLLLYNEFKSGKEAAIILLNLPLALIGGVFAIYFTNKVISIPAIIGFISLFGIATRNGMLLISHYNHLRREEKYSLTDSIIQGSQDRLNPILMTALSSAFALIPLAINGDLPGNEIQSPMAKVILGGLLTSTLLNGFIIPIIYKKIHAKSEEK